MRPSITRPARWLFFPGDPNTNANGTRAFAINDAGEVVGEYWNATDASQAFTYTNGAYADVTIPGVTPQVGIGIIGQETYATEITNTGSVVVEHAYNETGGGNNIESYIVSPTATAVTSTFNIVGNGTD